MEGEEQSPARSADKIERGEYGRSVVPLGTHAGRDRGADCQLANLGKGLPIFTSQEFLSAS